MEIQIPAEQVQNLKGQIDLTRAIANQLDEQEARLSHAVQALLLADVLNILRSVEARLEALEGNKPQIIVP